MRENEDKKYRLLKSLINEGVIKSEKVKRAFERVPREEFVPKAYKKYAYDDTPLPTLEGQTISAPHMCAIMCEVLDLERGDLVIEIGTGSGYHAALCTEIVSPENTFYGYVVTVEILERLAYFAKQNLSNTSYYSKVDVVVADGSISLPFRKNVFTKGLVTAAVPRIPENVLEVIRDKGSIVAPVGSKYFQELLVITKKGKEVSVSNYGGCIFVPLRGLGGYDI